MSHYVRDALSSKRQETRRRWMELLFRELSNDTPLVGVATTYLMSLLALSGLVFFLLIFGELLRLHHCLFLSTGKYKQPYYTAYKKVGDIAEVLRRVRQGYVSSIGRPESTHILFINHPV
jgi:hypothetical protein